MTLTAATVLVAGAAMAIGPAPAAASAMAIVGAVAARVASRGTGAVSRAADAALCVGLGNELAWIIATWLPLISG